jgi:carboxyl-terminal processing protease
MLRLVQATCICLLLNGSLFSQAPSCEKVSILIKFLKEHHLQSPTFNDAWATQVYEETFSLLDPNHSLFTDADLNDLAVHKITLATDPATSSCALVQEIGKHYANRIAEAELYITNLLKSNLVFSDEESLRFDLHPTAWWPDRAALESNWQSRIKYQCLVWMQRNSEMGLSTLAPRDLLLLEERARAAVLKSEQLRFAQMKAVALNENNSLAVVFFKAIAHSFDPHSEYFTPHQKEQFFNSLDKEGLSFGIQWAEDQFGRIKIAQLYPGGAGWKSNELNQGDELLSVTLKGQSAKDVLLYDLETLYSDFESPENKEVSIVVKKTDGQVRTVKLSKIKIELDDNVIRSFVLSGKTKVGYISLPGFYGKDGESTKGCADDVAREILKLKKENIEGLILDLRFNGGGSLLEAIKLAGIFIDNGPLAIIQETNQPVITLKDINRGTLYNGPLVVMVNGYSASASELVAAALQDWNRAILVGSKTYGKATGQIIVQVNPPLNGFIKITNERLYRVTGKSLQQKGVVPDISFPDAFEIFMEHEKDLRNAFAPDSLNKKVYYTPLAALPITELKSRSEKRQASAFKEILVMAEQFKRPIPLHPGLYAAYLSQVKMPLDQVTANTYSVSVTGFDSNLLNVDNHLKIVNDEMLEEIRKSRYIEEAFYIILDYLSLTKMK